MSFGGGAALSRYCGGGDWSRLVTVYLRPASWTPLSSTIRLNRSARRGPGAGAVVAGECTGSAGRERVVADRPADGDRRGNRRRPCVVRLAGWLGQPRADRHQRLRLAEQLPSRAGQVVKHVDLQVLRRRVGTGVDEDRRVLRRVQFLAQLRIRVGEPHAAWTGGAADPRLPAE